MSRLGRFALRTTVAMLLPVAGALTVLGCAAWRNDPASAAATALDVLDRATDATDRANEEANRACGAYAEAVALRLIRADPRISGRCVARVPSAP